MCMLLDQDVLQGNMPTKIVSSVEIYFYSLYYYYLFIKQAKNCTIT